MKKFLLALTAAAAIAGSANAADIAPRAYTKAPPPVAPIYNWTGFYAFGGAGGGLWAADTTLQFTATGVCILCVNQRQGGSGWYGTVGAGYDWQVNPTWVVGVFGDGQFGSLNGTIQQPLVAGSEKMREAWAAGVRAGYLVAPNVLSYINGGYSGSNWSGTSLLLATTGIPLGHTDGFNRSGWFIGGGVENNLSIFGLSSPGWFMKTEYRTAYYGRKAISELVDGTNAPAGLDITFKPWVQTISTSIVYRFNWAGPVVAKY